MGNSIKVLTTEEDLLAIIASDQWMMDILRTARSLELPDWWIGAGFVRNAVWDFLHGYEERTPLNDIDVIYFKKIHRSSTELAFLFDLIAENKPNPLWEKEKQLEEKLTRYNPSLSWSVKNQFRMHLKNGDPPYFSSVDALAHWTETATCVGVSLDHKDQLHLTAPYGLSDLFQLLVRPTPFLAYRIGIYRERILRKKWKETWPRLQIIDSI
ncbi:nucleotidyltransferase family protein [Candidatus Woesearchaeota archaeon]|nr:nucleotidyltransferase family protein [Candidatus Woesearchaeota archaeon]